MKRSHIIPGSLAGATVLAGALLLALPARRVEMASRPPAAPPRQEEPITAQAALPVAQTPEISRLEKGIVQAVNKVRAQNGLPALKNMPTLAGVGRFHSRDMARKNYFAHTSPSGRNLFDRLPDAGITYRGAGENIFKTTGVSEDRMVALAVEQWMDSPSHRANILHRQWTHTGVGIWRKGSSYWFTQEFLLP